MRGKILVYGFAAFVAAFGFTPAPVQAHGDRVSVKDSYMPGTIVIRSGERRLYYIVGRGGNEVIGNPEVRYWGCCSARHFIH